MDVVAVNQALILHPIAAKIEEQPNPAPACSRIGKRLHVVLGLQDAGGFDFEQYVLHDKIYPLRANLLPLIAHRDLHLAAEIQATHGEFARKGTLIESLLETRTQPSMHLEYGGQNSLRTWIPARFRHGTDLLTNRCRASW